MGTFSSSIDKDEMSHYAAFHQGLHCFVKVKQSSGTEMDHSSEMQNFDRFNSKMGYSILIEKNPSEYKGLTS